ncbi:MAG: hypothetical protein ACKO9Z_14785, partial [Planctomycetota bacterium]
MKGLHTNALRPQINHDDGNPRVGAIVQARTRPDNPAQGDPHPIFPVGPRNGKSEASLPKHQPDGCLVWRHHPERIGLIQ